MRLRDEGESLKVILLFKNYKIRKVIHTFVQKHLIIGSLSSRRQLIIVEIYMRYEWIEPNFLRFIPLKINKCCRNKITRFQCFRHDIPSSPQKSIFWFTINSFNLCSKYAISALNINKRIIFR